MPGKDVDGTAFTPEMEGDFGRRIPAVARQQVEDSFDDLRVVAIEQTIEFFPTPENAHEQPRAEFGKYPVEPADGDAIRITPFDSRDLRARHSDAPTGLLLCPSALPSKRANLESYPNHVHARSLASEPYRGVTRALG